MVEDISVSYLMCPWKYNYQILCAAGSGVGGRGSLPGSESRLLSNTWKYLVRGDAHADKPRDLVGTGCPGRQQQSKGTQENCSTTWLTVWGFMVMELVSILSLANHSDSKSLLVTSALLSQDGFQQEGFWEVSRTYELVFPLSF